MTAEATDLRALTTVGILMLASCTVGAKKAGTGESAEAPTVPGTISTTLVFPNGKATLSSEHKHFIRQLLKKAEQSSRPISEIKILAWADEEYPEYEEIRTSPRAVSLAAARNLSIRDYLVLDLGESRDIDTYNMAQRPALISKLFRDDDFLIKDAFEASGATASRLPDGRTSYTKSAKALVIIDYEDRY